MASLLFPKSLITFTMIKNKDTWNKEIKYKESGNIKRARIRYDNRSKMFYFIKPGSRFYLKTQTINLKSIGIICMDWLAL